MHLDPTIWRPRQGIWATPHHPVVGLRPAVKIWNTQNWSMRVEPWCRSCLKHLWKVNKNWTYTGWCKKMSKHSGIFWHPIWSFLAVWSYTSSQSFSPKCSVPWAIICTNLMDANEVDVHMVAKNGNQSFSIIRGFHGVLPEKKFGTKVPLNCFFWFIAFWVSLHPILFLHQPKTSPTGLTTSCICPAKAALDWRPRPWVKSHPKILK